jgi:hypothetical protein
MESRDDAVIDQVGPTMDVDQTSLPEGWSSEVPPRRANSFYERFGIPQERRAKDTGVGS